MNTSDSRATILKQLFSQYGDELLRDRDRFAGFILDHLGSDRIARFLIKSLDEGIFQRVLDLGGADADVLALDRLIRTLHEDEGYDKTIAQEVVNLWYIGLQGLKQFSQTAVLPADSAHPSRQLARGRFTSPQHQQNGWQKQIGRGRFMTGFGLADQSVLLVFYGGAGVFVRSSLQPTLWIETAIEAAALSAEQDWLAVGMPDGTVEIWNLESGFCQFTLKGHAVPVSLLRFSSDQRFLLSGDRQGWIRLWDTTSGIEARCWQAHKTGLLDAIFTRDGTSLITAGKDSNVLLWDIASGSLLKKWPIYRMVYSLGSTLDGRALVTGDEQMVTLWDWDSGSFLKNIVVHPDTVKRVEILSNGCLLSVSEKAVICSKLDDERFIQRMDASPFTAVQAICLPDESILVAEYDENHLRVFSTANPGEEWLHLTRFSSLVTAMAFSPQGDRLACATDDRIVLHDLTRGNERLDSVRLRTVVYDLAFLADARRLVFCGADGCLRLAEIGRQGPERVLFQSTDWLNALVVLPGGERVAVGGDNGEIALVQASDGRVVRQWSNGTAATALACSPDGRYIAAGGEDGSLAVWEVSSGQLRFRHSAHQGIVRSVAFSNDGSWLASGGEDGVVQVFGLPAGQQMHRFTHPSWVTRIVFHPQDAILATACGDGSLWLRSLSSRCKEIRRRLSGETISGLAFSPNGDSLAVSSEDGTLAIWKVDQLLR
ncbi:MAG: WD40 repeat domain-containing protein [Anaerolineales bacterium]